jgi:hypothetical protein
MNKIQFEGFPTPIKNFPQKFHKLTATMIKGVPNDTHFGIGTPDGFPSVKGLPQQRCHILLS